MALFEGLRADGAFFSNTGSGSDADRDSASLDEGSSDPEFSFWVNESDSKFSDESFPASASKLASPFALVPPFVFTPPFPTGVLSSSTLAKFAGGYPKQEVSTRH